MNATCAARTFCACNACRNFSYETEGGAHRGTPITTRDERKRSRTHYVPTHRKTQA